MYARADRDAALLASLDRLRHSAAEIRGCLLASTDGLLIAANMPKDVADGLAALCAACLGVSQRVADIAGHDEFKEVVISSAGGYVAMYRLSDAAVLVILAAERANVGRLNHEARQATPEIRTILQDDSTGADEGQAQLVDPLPPHPDRRPRRASSRR